MSKRGKGSRQSIYTNNKFQQLDSPSADTTLAQQRDLLARSRPLTNAELAAKNYNTPTTHAYNLLDPEERGHYEDEQLFAAQPLFTPEAYKPPTRRPEDDIKELQSEFAESLQTVEKSAKNVESTFKRYEIKDNQTYKKLNDQLTPVVKPKVTAKSLEHLISPTKRKTIVIHKTVAEMNDLRTPTTKYKDAVVVNKKKFTIELPIANLPYDTQFTPGVLNTAYQQGGALDIAKRARERKIVSSLQETAMLLPTATPTIPSSPSDVVGNIFYPQPIAPREKYDMEIEDPALFAQKEHYDEYQRRFAHRKPGYDEAQEAYQREYVNKQFDMREHVEPHEMLEKPINYYIPTQYDPGTQFLQPESFTQQLLAQLHQQPLLGMDGNLALMVGTITELCHAVNHLTTEVADLKKNGVVGTSSAAKVAAPAAAAPETKSTLPTGPRPAFLGAIGGGADSLKNRPPNPMAAMFANAKKEPLNSVGSNNNNKPAPGGKAAPAAFDPNAILKVQLRSANRDPPPPRDTKPTDSQQTSQFAFALRKANANPTTDPTSSSSGDNNANAPFRPQLRNWQAGPQPKVEQPQVQQTLAVLRKVQPNEHKLNTGPKLSEFEQQLLQMGKRTLVGRLVNSPVTYSYIKPQQQTTQQQQQQQNEQRPAWATQNKWGTFQPRFGATNNNTDHTSNWTPIVAKAAVPVKQPTPRTPDEVKAQQKLQYSFRALVARNLQHCLEQQRIEKQGGPEHYDVVGGATKVEYEKVGVVNKYIKEDLQKVQTIAFQPPTAKKKSKKSKNNNAVVTTTTTTSSHDVSTTSIAPLSIVGGGKRKDITKALLYAQDDTTKLPQSTKKQQKQQSQQQQVAKRRNTTVTNNNNNNSNNNIHNNNTQEHNHADDNALHVSSWFGADDSMMASPTLLNMSLIQQDDDNDGDNNNNQFINTQIIEDQHNISDVSFVSALDKSMILPITPTVMNTTATFTAANSSTDNNNDNDSAQQGPNTSAMKVDDAQETSIFDVSCISTSNNVNDDDEEEQQQDKQEIEQEKQEVQQQQQNDAVIDLPNLPSPNIVIEDEQQIESVVITPPTPVVMSPTPQQQQTTITPTISQKSVNKKQQQLHTTPQPTPQQYKSVNIHTTPPLSMTPTSSHHTIATQGNNINNTRGTMMSPTLSTVSSANSNNNNNTNQNNGNTSSSPESNDGVYERLTLSPPITRSICAILSPKRLRSPSPATQHHHALLSPAAKRAHLAGPQQQLQTPALNSTLSRPAPPGSAMVSSRRLTAATPNNPGFNKRGPIAAAKPTPLLKRSRMVPSAQETIIEESFCDMLETPSFQL